MITTIVARNVNNALEDSMWKLKLLGHLEDSRNGSVLVMPGPVVTEYERPQERVLLNGARDANPYFHLMESLWMLAGRHDVDFLAQFVKRMHSYSDDGITLHGAYGFRWRRLWDKDQLLTVIEMLRSDPTTRRAVIAMWYPPFDLWFTSDDNEVSKDIPCNTHIYLRVHHDNDNAIPELDMTVCCRSNDAVWGAHGANAVHFSVLQEFLAHGIGVAIGTLYQVSNNYHVYLEQYDPGVLCTAFAADRRYEGGDTGVRPSPLIRNSTIENWLRDLRIFLEHPGGDIQYGDDFFNEVAKPMYASWMAHKAGFPVQALVSANQIDASDWQTACREWLQRRSK